MNSELTHLRDSQQQAVQHSTDEAEQQMKKLRNDLALAKADAENLKTAASVNSTLANAPGEDGSKSVAEQVAEHVATVRTELEARHNERVQQNEDAFRLRSKNMAAQLSDKLREARLKIRQELAAEHEQVIQKLTTEHTQDIEKLEARHKDEMEELRQVEEAKFAELKASSHQESQAQTPPDGRTEVKTEIQKPSGVWQPSQQEIRTLIQNNDFLKGILKQNLTKHVNKSKEDLTAQLKEQHEKALADNQSKNDAAKEHAVALAGKKSSLQLNMATNKSKILEFKLGLVNKAAQETPQKPVQEVWILVKDAKPPVAPIAAPTAAPTVAPPEQTQQAASKAQPPTTSTFGRPTPAAQPAMADSLQSQQSVPNSTTTFGQPTPATADIQNHSLDVQSSQEPKPTLQPTSDTPTGPEQPEKSRSASNLPTVSGQNVQTQPHTAGSGPAPSRGSGIPRGGMIRGNATTRGGPNSRARGSGIARGATRSTDTNRAAQGAQQNKGSPNSALNAGAKQFVPGNKRPSEDPQGGDGKRIRGEGGTGAL